MIIGISGVAGAGKDTAAKLLQPYGAVNVALADPLKRIARDIYEFSEDQLWGPSAERNKPDPRYPREHLFGACPSTGGYATCVVCGALSDGKTPICYLTPRYALQILGTEWGRHCYPDTWATKCIRTAQRLFEEPTLSYTPQDGLFHYSDLTVPKLVTISDVRFQNEMRVIRQAGGKIIRVRRPGSGLTGSAGLHPSETEQLSIPDDDFDFVISNENEDPPFEKLQGIVKDMVRRLYSLRLGLL